MDEMFQNVPERRDDEPPKAIKRDRWGRPLILQPDGSSMPYTRASTMAGALDDKTSLGDWKARMTGRGVATSLDLQAGFAAIPDMDTKDGKETANELAEQARERAGANKKRVMGTAIHSFTEVIDRGGKPEHVPQDLHKVLRNYMSVTAGVRWLAFEQFVVVDSVFAAGTADRIGVRDGELPRVWDIKTGRVDYGHLKFAVQLALYAHGQLYNPATGARRPWPQVDLSIGHILHVDPVSGEVQPYDVDLLKGWEAAQAARMVYDMRKDKGIMHPSSPAGSKTLMQQLAACRTLEQLSALYKATGKQWEPKHKKFADIMAEDIKSRISLTPAITS